MAGVDPVNHSSGYPRADDETESEKTLDLGRPENLHSPTERAPFAPGGHPLPSRETGVPAQNASRAPQFRAGPSAGQPTVRVPDDLVERGYSKAALEHLASVAGGPSAFEALRSLHTAWSTVDRSSLRQLHKAVTLLHEPKPGNENDARPQTLAALLESHEALTRWGCSDVELLDIAGWFNESDPSRATALRTLRDDRDWLEQRDYRPIDMRPLAERSDFPEIMNALHEHDESLRGAGFSSSGIAEAARNEAGADSVATLAARHQHLVALGYEPAQLARFASIYGPELIDLLANHPELTNEYGPLGIGPLIAEIGDETSDAVLAGLRAKIEALPPAPPVSSKPTGLGERLAARLGIRRRNNVEE